MHTSWAFRHSYLHKYTVISRITCQCTPLHVTVKRNRGAMWHRLTFTKYQVNGLLSIRCSYHLIFNFYELGNIRIERSITQSTASGLSVHVCAVFTCSHYKWQALWLHQSVTVLGSVHNIWIHNSLCALITITLHNIIAMKTIALKKINVIQ